MNQRTSKPTGTSWPVNLMMSHLLTLFCRLVNSILDFRTEFLNMGSCKRLFFRYIKSSRALTDDNIYFTRDVSNTDVYRIRFQTEDASCQWHPQSPSRQDHRCALSPRRFFRSQRSVASEVRDDTASRSRGVVGNPVGECLWHVQALILPRSCRVHPRRPGGADSEKTGPQGCLQTLCRGHGICPGLAPRQPAVDDRATGSSDCKAVWCRGSSPKYRESFRAAGKKTDVDLTANSVLPDLIERYEVLRDPLSQRDTWQGAGWLVLVQRGLRAWSQIVQPQLPSATPLPAVHGVPAHLQEPVTHVLASMVLQVYPEVAHVN